MAEPAAIGPGLLPINQFYRIDQMHLIFLLGERKCIGPGCGPDVKNCRRPWRKISSENLLDPKPFQFALRRTRQSL
jgi:hypothetical protein